MSKQQLLRIRELIRDEQYDAARQQLEPLARRGNPTAKKWLVNLNRIAPPRRATQSDPFDYGKERLEDIEQQKEEKRRAERQQKNQQRTVGCLMRGCSLTVFLGMIAFLMMPAMLVAGVTSTNPQAQDITRTVFTFVEEQQENPVGRAMTNAYTSTSGRAMKTVIEPRQEQICDVAIEQAANNGRRVTRAECEQTFEEAMTCVTNEFDEAEQCLRSYMHNRCLEQVGTSPQAQDYCRDFVRQHMGP